MNAPGGFKRFCRRIGLPVVLVALPLWLGWEGWNRAVGSETIRSDERVALSPVLARPLPDGRIEIPLEVWVHEPESGDRLRQSLIREIEKHLLLTGEEKESAILRSRLAPLLADNERGKRVRVRWADQELPLPVTAADGRSREVFVLDPPDSGLPDRVAAVLPDSHPQSGEGASAPVFLLEPEELLLISDIDDTVKISNVRDKKALMRATFLEPFRAAPGMADRYRRWMADGRMHLHFVSASPQALDGLLGEFLSESGFPPATRTLKPVRLKDATVLDLLEDPAGYKERVIGDLLERFPQQPVVLVGDSGEKDPEAYGALARKFGDRVRRIFIRNVTGELPADARFTAAFTGIEAGRWQLFDDPMELPDSLVNN